MQTLTSTPAPAGQAPARPTGGPGVAARRPRWARSALVVLLAATAVSYLWDLGASGDANSFYAAAVQAGTSSWKAFFFGSLDASNFITVDKPPASLWVMDLSGRLFGFSSWSMLVPEALMGVAAVGLTYLAVRRWFGDAAGLVAGAVLAATPVAALMFRFNNPDALLVLLVTASAYTLTRAIERAGTRWVVATGALLGLAFLAKMLQAFTVLPGFAVVYLVVAPTTLRRRVLQLLAGGAALVVAAGWWVAVVALWPAGSRPYIDGSTDNSIINLILGYNGLGRLSGSASGPGAQGQGGGGGFSGTPGILRLFNDLMGGQASWLLPAALIALVAGVAACGRAARSDRRRAALLLWGSWLVVTGLVFSFGKGVIHTYYTVALAPAIAALIGIGTALLWSARRRRAARLTGAAAVAATAAWAYALLDRTPSWHPWLRVLMVAAAAIAAIGLLAGELPGRRLTMAALALGLTASLAGPVAYTLSTIGTPETGGVPSAGPAVASTVGRGGPGGAGGFRPGRAAGGPRAFGGGPAGAGFAGGPPGAGGPGPSAGGGAGAGGVGPGAAAPGATGAGGVGAGGAGAGAGGPSAGPGRPIGAGRAGASGGPGGGMTTSAALTTALKADANRFRWVAATFGSQSAAGIELSTGEPVMAIGGFSGGGELTLAQFEAYVARGDLHYFLATRGGGPGDRSSESAITSWVESRFKAVTLGGQTVYDLTARTS